MNLTIENNLGHHSTGERGIHCHGVVDSCLEKGLFLA